MEHELLQAISDLMDQKLEPITMRLDKMETHFDVLEYKGNRTAKKLNELRFRAESTEIEIRNEIRLTRDELDTLIKLLKVHKIIQV